MTNPERRKINGRAIAKAIQNKEMRELSRELEKFNRALKADGNNPAIIDFIKRGIARIEAQMAEVTAQSIRFKY